MSLLAGRSLTLTRFSFHIDARGICRLASSLVKTPLDPAAWMTNTSSAPILKRDLEKSPYGQKIIPTPGGGGADPMSWVFAYHWATNTLKMESSSERRFKEETSLLDGILETLQD